MPNVGYHLARLKGNFVRRLYSLLLPWIVRRRVVPSRRIDIDVFAYSGEDMVPEQVSSVRSFLRNAGRPRSFTIVSDGSHTDRSLRLLRAIDPVVTVRPPNEPPNDLPEKFRNYLATHPTGKQLALIMSLPVSGPALYVDSDVRFFPGADALVNRAAEKGASAYYLPDCQFSGDDRLLRSPAERSTPVNTGFLLLFQKLDWSEAVARFLAMEGEPQFFTNQTLTHLVMHKNGAQPFASSKYVLQLDDQFVFRDRYASANLVLRHYVNPVRHKFWTSLRH